MDRETYDKIRGMAAEPAKPVMEDGQGVCRWRYGDDGDFIRGCSPLYSSWLPETCPGCGRRVEVKP